ncbi:hypothetical protein NM680_18515 [Paracoccus sp. PS-1]|uniref:hypothetical protein n=1 Tax=unclassified Paracoccus (in: a-proteobacteria) TaxID=2688777 RepID=UPI00048AC95B|nr:MULTISPECIES: hypothetical protein [unclassified Paracoccus (in: a-proteobacteria)]MDQ7263793.1 hypothetical protein [Paracoccus sp. PS1]RQP07498.1 MAG: hypothetical protein D1H97_02440 [Paracoccus sp. BP8]UFM65221.1 hypothetical protein LOS78_16380 [Paracoccus sp. MA]
MTRVEELPDETIAWILEREVSADVALADIELNLGQEPDELSLYRINVLHEAARRLRTRLAEAGP